MCSGQFETLRSTNACVVVVPMLHAVQASSMAVNTCFFSNWATTSKIWPPGAPKLGAELIFMTSIGRSSHWYSIIIRTPPISSSNMSKTGKINKIRYIRYKSKIHYIYKVKNRFSIDLVCFGQFETLRSTNARVVSDATCCASMAVNLCFFSFIVFGAQHRK